MHDKRRVWCSRSINGTLTRCSITRQLHTSPRTHIYSVDGYKIHKKPTHQQKYKVLLYSAAVLFWLIWWCIFLPSSSIIGWETFFKWDFFNQPITSQETRGLPRAPLPPSSPLIGCPWGSESALAAVGCPLLSQWGESNCCVLSAPSCGAPSAAASLQSGRWSEICAHTGEEPRGPPNTLHHQNNTRNICIHTNQYISPHSVVIFSQICV